MVLKYSILHWTQEIYYFSPNHILTNAIGKLEQWPIIVIKYISVVVSLPQLKETVKKKNLNAVPARVFQCRLQTDHSESKQDQNSAFDIVLFGNILSLLFFSVKTGQNEPKESVKTARNDEKLGNKSK